MKFSDLTVALFDNAQRGKKSFAISLFGGKPGIKCGNYFAFIKEFSINLEISGKKLFLNSFEDVNCPLFLVLGSIDEKIEIVGLENDVEIFSSASDKILGEIILLGEDFKGKPFSLHAIWAPSDGDSIVSSVIADSTEDFLLHLWCLKARSNINSAAGGANENTRY